ncbi:hypothetical protein F5148DRAFT_1289528 [Russula earlei]|uniref:Uncharacterized protein n=1 Tax=Russula earlei TaxID=71964 RepID=A0ACC0TYB3_9AGAM|nr:hypothetical protein F5148DRAFT_1289528 [Russula earlei]
MPIDMKRIIFVITVLTAMVSCGPTTTIEKSWRDPDVTVNTASVHKFVVAALLRNEAVRRSTEDQMAALYPGKAVPSYSVLGSKELTDPEDVYKQRFQQQGYDGVVILRLVNVDKEQRYVPGTYPAYYGSWWGYYRYAWPTFYDPGYYTTDKTYYVEVNVYSLTRNRLIWSGITSTINPSSRDQLFGDVIKTVSKKMKQQGFVE